MSRQAIGRWWWVALLLLALLGTVGGTAGLSRLSPAIAASPSIAAMPLLKPHPLPSALAAWHDRSGDYFDQIQPVSVGYLVWSQFPVTVYVEPIAKSDTLPSAIRRSRDWITAVQQAVQEWNVYLPLQLVEQPETADIRVWRSAPPLQVQRDPKTDRLILGRVRAAETRFELVIAAARLSHRVTVHLRPDQAPDYTLATARHELGHAIGLWGHSPKPTDALYFAQVGTPPPISARDVSTLKRVYEQPTRLGWSLPE